MIYKLKFPDKETADNFLNGKKFISVVRIGFPVKEWIGEGKDKTAVFETYYLVDIMSKEVIESEYIINPTNSIHKFLGHE